MSESERPKPREEAIKRAVLRLELYDEAIQILWRIYNSDIEDDSTGVPTAEIEQLLKRAGILK